MRWPSREPAARGGEAHALLAAGDDDLVVTGHDGLSRQHHGLEAGAADLVDGHGRHALRQAGLDDRLTRRVLAAASGEHLTEDDLADLLATEAAAAQQVLMTVAPSSGRPSWPNDAAELADGGAGSGDDDDVLGHGIAPVKLKTGIWNQAVC